MQPRDERNVVREVYERLAPQFLDLPDEYVEAVVRLEHAALTGPVRTFVPILVQRSSVARLQRIRSELAGGAAVAAEPLATVSWPSR